MTEIKILVVHFLLIIFKCERSDRVHNKNDSKLKLKRIKIKVISKKEKDVTTSKFGCIYVFI